MPAARGIILIYKKKSLDDIGNYGSKASRIKYKKLKKKDFSVYRQCSVLSTRALIIKSKNSFYPIECNICIEALRSR